MAIQANIRMTFCRPQRVLAIWQNVILSILEKSSVAKAISQSAVDEQQRTDKGLNARGFQRSVGGRYSVLPPIQYKLILTNDFCSIKPCLK